MPNSKPRIRTNTKPRQKRQPSGGAIPPSNTIADQVPTARLARLGRRGVVFAIFCTVCLLAAGGYVGWAVVRDRTAGQAVEGPMDGIGSPGTIARVSDSEGGLLFQNVLSGDHWNQIGIVPLNETNGGRSMLPFRCLRISFADGRGLCLADEGGLAGNYSAYIFDADLRLVDEVELGGLPSRTRVAPDARYGAATSFVTGHSYAEDGFSTETLLIDMANGDAINLEEFAVYRDGQQIDEESFNYWGVTFANDTNRFYATLAFLGRTYLVEGNIAEHRVQLLHENVECPSISPDNTRIAYKKRVDEGVGGTVWRFHVLDLATMTETPLAETRSIDDQIEWLDNDRVLYGDGSDTWIMPADGTGEPSRFMSQAISPTVIRNGGAVAADAPDMAVTASDPSSDLDVLFLPEADLGVTLSVEANAGGVGEQLTYTATITNHGPAEATGLKVEFVLPAGAMLVPANSTDPPGLDVGCVVYPDAGTVQCDAPQLPTGSQWVIVIEVKPTRNGAHTSTVLVNGSEADSNSANDKAAVEVTVGS